ncbi:MAG: DUF4387 domain-containing protein [Armatimonadota bacterium]
MTLYNLAAVMRSKNAGPFVVTVDIFLEDLVDYRRVLDAPDFCESRIAKMYGAAPAEVRIRPFERVLAIKVSFPRPGASSGAVGDRDVYGCQQHFPLGDVEV